MSAQADIGFTEDPEVSPGNGVRNISYEVSAPAARLSGITIYSTPTAFGGGHRMLSLTLRATRGLLGNLNLMTSRAAGEGWESIHFDRVRLDKRAGEKW